MYPFTKPAYQALEADQRKELCSLSYRICSATRNWSPNTKPALLELLSKAMQLGRFIYRDLHTSYEELQEINPITRVPGSILEYVRSYFGQFYIVRDKKLCLPPCENNSKEPVPQIRTEAHVYTQPATTASGKIKAITEETWWVIRVKNSYRMCKLTFDRGEYWEMVEYVGGKVHNPQYRFPKYDNRVIYEFKEHLTPDMFEDKIKEAVEIRKAALTQQAHKLLSRYRTVIIARHLTGGTLVGGVEDEDDTNWYLDTYTEQGERLFFGENRWVLNKNSRCTVVLILKRK